ncbi:MAG: acetyl-CoA carboxylase biotin carboxyl carrier protein subunit [Sulfobacillus acidophilus]|uniref:Acetyl-CoA carboxylase biotin carboxyl carrier protein subunit n=1 Tax=Sulfobacillus acidophilus TaxID=53633 RepID=A0A2T2WFX2_9FIRM|nr:MAG: acetyl-CoA carboxylase biotin carboxyl carrier protein subunit [Sulfobacillus acidophilus]
MPTVRRFRVTVNGKVYEVEAEELAQTEAKTVVHDAASQSNRAPEPAFAKPPSAGVSIEAPLPGSVLDVKVAVGQSVDAGQVLVILEAMKMENEIIAPDAGIVADVRVAKGHSVSAGDVLVVLQ